jgi:subtilase family serine protease
MTLIASSGDTGAAEVSCDGSTYVQEVSYPAIDPFITAVGGTQLHADLSTGAYHNEVSWNEPKLNAASGGGFSTSIHKPFYENSIDGMGQYRGIPDVSYDAGVADGGMLVKWSEAPKGPGFYTVGGTSAGSPQWAGIAALADQYGQNRIGLLNPVLYCINQGSNYSSNFYDVNSGSNSATLSDTKNKSVTIQGYSAGRNWDATTGWGSPQAANLVPLLAHHDDVVNVSSNDLDSL